MKKFVISLAALAVLGIGFCVLIRADHQIRSARDQRCAELKPKPAEEMTAADVAESDTCAAVKAQRDELAAQQAREKITRVTQRCIDLKYRPVASLSLDDLNEIRACQAVGLISAR